MWKKILTFLGFLNAVREEYAPALEKGVPAVIAAFESGNPVDEVRATAALIEELRAAWQQSKQPKAA